MRKLIVALVGSWVIVAVASRFLLRFLHSYPLSWSLYWNPWIMWIVVAIETLAAAYVAYRITDRSVSAAILSGVIAFVVAVVSLLYEAIRLD